MKALIASLLVALSVNMAMAGDFEDGLAASQGQDFATALKIWKPLAAQGNARAQHNLGFMYERGEGVPQDYAEAARWYKLAVAQGVARSQVNLGLLYFEGQGVRQDYSETIRLFKLAAAPGKDTPSSNYGIGVGTATDAIRAAAGEPELEGQDAARAKYNLGYMYFEGVGVPQDYVRAHFWLNLAAATGLAAAVKSRDIVANEMTPQQIAEAQKMARECLASNYKKCD